MRTCASVAVATLMSLCVIGHQAHALALQDRESAGTLVEEFRASTVFWRQLEIGKKIAGLQNRQAVESLEPWLTHEDRHIRGNVAFLFAALGDGRGLDTIAAILQDRSDRREGQGIPGGRWSLNGQIRADRYYAVHLLGELKDARAVALLLPLLTDDEVNYKVAWALGEIGDPRAIRPLIDALGDRTALMRVSAIHGLEKLRAKEALPYLRALLDDHELPSAGDRVSVAATAKAAIVTLEQQR